MPARAALAEMYRQTGTRYVVTGADADVRADARVGPYRLGEDRALPELLGDVAASTGATVGWKGDVVLLEPAPGGAQAKRRKGRARAAAGDDRDAQRHAAAALGRSGQLSALGPLVELAASEDRSVRRAALEALAGFEGDFPRQEWPGRLSAFELPEVELDTDALLWAAEDTSAPGGPDWCAAVSVLGRARLGQLPRSIWHAPWGRAPGAMVPALWAMGRCGDPDARAVIEKRIRNTFTNSEADRFAAAAAAGKLGLTASLERLSSASDSGSNDPIVRCAAAYGLGFCAGRAREGATPALRRMLADPDARVRELAALTLGKLGTEACVESLRQLVADEETDAGLRFAAAMGLAEAGDEEGLVNAAGLPDVRVQAAAARGLGRLGGARALKALGELLGGEDRWVLAEAAASLGALGDSAATERLSAMLLDTETDGEVRIAIALGLGQGAAPGAANALEKVVFDAEGDSRLREYAVRALAQLAERAGQPALGKLLENEEANRSASGAAGSDLACLALLGLDLGEAADTVRCLGKWLTGGSVQQEACAAQRISELGTRDGVYLLMGGFNSFSNIVRSQQIIPLFSNRSAEVTDHLVSILTSSRRSGVRANCALALGGRCDPGAVDALMEACADSSAEVRAAAAHALGETGDPKAAGLLAELLAGDSDLTVAHCALRALRSRGFAGIEEARAALRKAAGSDRDCGVPGGPSVVEQGEHSWVLRRWAETYEDRRIPNLTYESSVTYDPVHRRVIQWGAHGRRYDSPQTAHLWEYTPGGGESAWERPFLRDEPPGTCMVRGAEAFDANRGCLVTPRSGSGGHGWVFALRRNLTSSIPWAYDSERKEWRAMRPLEEGQGSLGCYDPGNDVLLFFSGEHSVYDLHANEWTRVATPQRPLGPLTYVPYAFDTLRNRQVIVAGADARGRARTWVYELAANTLTELNTANPPAPFRGPMVYDAHNDVMLAFRTVRGGTQVHVLHLEENRWEEKELVHPCPSYGNTDAAYDSYRNLVVFCGGQEAAASGRTMVRETWTYRYKPSARQFDPEPAPQNLAAAAEADGSVRLAWGWSGEGPPPAFNIYRGRGERPWTAPLEKINEAPVEEPSYLDAGALAGGEGGSGRCYYQVRAIGAEGREGPASFLARTRPPPVEGVACTRAGDGSVKITWTPSAAADLAGYNVYRAARPAFDPWRERYSSPPAGDFARLNDRPLDSAGFEDRPGSEPGAGGAGAAPGESRWPSLYVYYVTAVNRAGAESGASPATLSIPAAPGPVLYVPAEDGRGLVLAGPSRSDPVRGYHLFRMDCHHNQLAYRLSGAPGSSVVLLDSVPWPRGDRRVYFVVPVGELGELGYPSSEAWAVEPP
jgi:HEAT repeat protein